jgi:hypothetical protein
MSDFATHRATVVARRILTMRRLRAAARVRGDASTAQKITLNLASATEALRWLNRRRHGKL